eukprot:gnl/MRDRNA2_/MRDRNA2_36184_c0_seq1.p1 gnl/MRDRNA2_/MRDRNA2_36184_c0~~gnl/MRDRNA2_/MRDRNA2_36184_c0_seq1.p1  ORF type:complete len:989 (+),score=186.91 gnl/MRDRNA2_/MRDRNA2_36184_c0_seq1:57-3023(+)
MRLCPSCMSLPKVTLVVVASKDRTELEWRSNLTCRSVKEWLHENFGAPLTSELKVLGRRGKVVVTLKDEEHIRKDEELMVHGVSNVSVKSSSIEQNRGYANMKVTEAPKLAFTFENAIWLQDELLKEFSDPEFQREMLKIMSDANHIKTKALTKRELIMGVQKNILPKYGFEGSLKGVHDMLVAYAPYMNDPQVFANTNRINRLIGQPEISAAQAAAQRNRSLPGTQKGVEDEKSSMELQEFQISPSAKGAPINEVKLQARGGKLTIDAAIQLQEDLKELYAAESFQSELMQLRDGGAEQQASFRELVLTEQVKVFPKYGFSASEEGVAEMVLAFKSLDLVGNPQSADHHLSATFVRNEAEINALLNMDPVIPVQEIKSETTFLVQSSVGGSGGEGDHLIPVAFWGICDIKYDRRLPWCERIRVLEFGDGRSSRFSHHGQALKLKFDAGYRMDEKPIKRAVLVENKKLTHDMFREQGLLHLRPPTGCYSRLYKPELADQIIQDLGCHGSSDGIVLKLCNRSRGAGVVVVTAGELDSVLHTLLQPPDGEDLKEFLKDTVPLAIHRDFSGSVLDEQQLHWWSNECPNFMAEKRCTSHFVDLDGVVAEPGTGGFDGTMRVAFSLWRPPRKHKKVQPFEGGEWQFLSSYEDDDDRHVNAQLNKTVEEFNIDWMGGYWKLPPNADNADVKAKNLEELRDSVVSSFSSKQKRTTVCQEQDLKEVYAALSPVLPKIFGPGNVGVQPILKAYKSSDPLFCCFALGRLGATLAGDRDKGAGVFTMSLNLLQSIERQMEQEQKELDLPIRSVKSYIERNLGVMHARHGDWKKASEFFQRSIESLPTNSTSYYLLGMFWLETSSYVDAERCMMYSISLDPDFKSPYVALGVALLHLRQFEKVLLAMEGCFQRHYDTPQAHYNYGQAVYHLAVQNSAVVTAEMIAKAQSSLELAKQRCPDQWLDEDEMILRFMTNGSKSSSTSSNARQGIRGWKMYGWRP